MLARVFDSGIKSYIDHSLLQGTAVHSSTVIDDIVIVSRLTWESGTNWDARIILSPLLFIASRKLQKLNRFIVS